MLIRRLPGFQKSYLASIALTLLLTGCGQVNSWLHGNVQGASGLPGVGTIPTAVFPEASLRSTTSSFQESGGLATVIVELSAAAPKAVDLPYVKAGTAVANGVDYTGAPAGTLHIEKGQRQGTISLQIVDDSFAENTETIIITLGDPVNATLGTSSSMTLEIIDNDSSGPLAIVPSTLAINPGSRWTIRASGGAAPYRFSILSGTGTIDADGAYQNVGSADGILVTDALGATATLNVSLVPIPYISTNVCAGFSTDFSGELFDDGGVGNYSSNLNCSFTVDPGIPSGKFRVTFQSFDLENTFDNLFVYSGIVEASKLTATLTGSSLPSDLNLNSSVISFRFNSDASIVRSGFLLRWFLLEAPLALKVLGSSTLKNGDTTDLLAIGGRGPYTFTVISGGGTISPSGSDPNLATYKAAAMSTDVTLRVTDSVGIFSDQTIRVSPASFFVSTATTVSETAGVINLAINLNGATNVPVTIPVFYGGTAILGTHYAMPVSSVTIPAGQTAVSLPITILNNAAYDPTKTIVVDLGTPTNADLGFPNRHVVAIRDAYLMSPLTLDTSFRGTGIYTRNGTANIDDYAFGVAVDSVGRIVIAGMTNDSGQGNNMNLVRLLGTDGSLDTAFNSTGIIAYNATFYDWGYDVKILPGDKLLVSGYREWSGRDAPTLWQYTSTGVLDTTFNTTGVAAAQWSGIEIEGRHVIQTLDGGYLVVGSQYSNYLALSKFTAAGALDTTFGTTGKVTFSALSSCFAMTGAVDSTGKIYVVGQCKPRGASGDLDLVIWKYNTNGTLDTSFATTGYKIIDGTGGTALKDEAASGLVIDPSDNLIVTGYATRSDDRTDIDRFHLKYATQFRPSAPVNFMQVHHPISS